MLKVVANEAVGAEVALGIDDFCREGARRMLAVALEAEVDAYIESHTDELDDDGHRLVVRNGHAEARKIKTVAGSVSVEAPRVNDKWVDSQTGEKQKFPQLDPPPVLLVNTPRSPQPSFRQRR